MAIKFLIEIEPPAVADLPRCEYRVREELQFYVQRLMQFYYPLPVRTITVTVLEENQVVVDADALLRLQEKAAP